MEHHDDLLRDQVYHRLVTWFDNNGRTFGWREPTCSPWGIVVSEVMSHQTPMARVEPVWNTWMERWPTPKALADAEVADVIVAWGNLGYPRRALRLHEAATVIATDFNNQVPDTYEQLIALPGIGDYTASAVMAFAFHRYSVVLDTNIRRVLSRVFDGKDQSPKSMTVKERDRYSQLVPQSDDKAWQWNQSLMELGALVCTATQPECGQCVLRDECRWVKAGSPAEVRRTKEQKFTGTDRQGRGRIMKLLREADNHTSDVDSALKAAAVRNNDKQQPMRVLQSLLDDKLIVYIDQHHIGLP